MLATAHPGVRNESPRGPSRMRLCVLFFVALATPLAAQIHSVPTQRVVALDAGDQINPNPIIRVYTPTGIELFTLSSLPGSAQARALDFDSNGYGYLCRGDLVHQLDPSGVPTGVQFTPPTGAAQAQDVLQTPKGDILVAWGATQPTSAIARYDMSGAMFSSFTDPMLDHPRRIATTSDPASSTVYIANRAAQQIVSFDFRSPSPTLQVVADMSAMNIGCVGLCYDAANDDLWVTSSFGQSNEIGCVDISNDLGMGTYSTAINYPPTGAAGMTAPAGLFYDRFRNLYVAGRDRNSGTPGVYIFRATSPLSAPLFLQSFPRTGSTPTNIIDVALQASPMTTCAPMEFTDDGPRHVLEMGAMNEIKFDSPETSGVPYAAGLSMRWQQSTCGALYQQGILELLFGGLDPRGLPLRSDDYLWSSLAVTPGLPGIPSSAIPLNPMGMPYESNFALIPPGGGTVSGFLGNLDVNGSASGILDLTAFVDPMNSEALDGMEFSLAWVTIDSTEAALIGFISEPLCIVMRNPDVSPISAVLCQ